MVKNTTEIKKEITEIFCPATLKNKDKLVAEVENIILGTSLNTTIECTAALAEIDVQSTLSWKRHLYLH